VNDWGWIAAGLLLAGALWTDLRSMVIPNAMTVGFGIAGLSLHGLIEGFRGLAWAGTGMFAGIVPLLVMYLFRGLGGGDVKWFGAAGCWIGAPAVLQLAIDSVLIAGGLALLLLLFRLPAARSIGARMPWPWGEHPVHGRGVKFPFMLAVTPAFALVWLAGG
jgi:prepilin peptidase CpaA